MLRTIAFHFAILTLFAVSYDCYSTELTCDSAQFFLKKFESFQKGPEDSAIYSIDKAVNAAKNCGKHRDEVSYLLEKANFLNAHGKSIDAQNINKRALDRAFLIGDSVLLAGTYQNFGILLTDASEFDSAIILFDQAMEFMSSNIVDSAKLSDIYVQRGIAKDRKGFYEKALVDYFSSLNISVAIHDTLAVGQLYNNIAIVYKRQEDLLGAKEYYTKSLEISKQRNDEFGVAISNVNIGLLEKDLNKFDSADSLFNVSLEFFERTDHNYGIAVVLHNMGELKRKEKKLSEAIVHYSKSQFYANKLDFKQINAKNNLSLAQLNFSKGDINAALNHALKSLEIAKKQGMLEEECNAQKILAEIYERRGQPQKALSAYKIYHTLEDSIFNEHKTEIINQLKTKYESTQKDVEIEVLKKEQALQEAQLLASQKQKRFLTFLSISLILIFGLLVYGYVKTRRYYIRLNMQREEIGRQNEEIELKQRELISKNRKLEKVNQEKDDLINIVAHDLRSPLNQIKGLMSVLKMELQEKETQNSENYFLNINTAINTLLNRINSILDVELINSEHVQVDLQPINPCQLMTNIHSSFERLAAKKGIKISNQCNGSVLSMKADYNYTLQVMENLVSNAIKFSSSGEDIALRISETDDHIRLHVKDQGQGLTEEDQQDLFKKFSRLSAKPTGNEKSIGLGLAIVKKYVENMNGKVWCVSKKGIGSEFVVEFAKA